MLGFTGLDLISKKEIWLLTTKKQSKNSTLASTYSYIGKVACVYFGMEVYISVKIPSIQL